MAKSEQRTQYVVHRGLQARFTRVLLGISVLYLLGYLYVILSMRRQLAWSFEQVLFAAGGPSPQVLAQLQVLDRAMLLQMIAMAAVLMIVVGIFGILITHRIAGPLVRIQAAMRALPRSGAVPPLRLRAGDELGELANEVNRIAEQLHRDGSADLGRMDELGALLEELPEEARERAREILEALRTSRRTHVAE